MIKTIMLKFHSPVNHEDFIMYNSIHVESIDISVNADITNSVRNIMYYFNLDDLSLLVPEISDPMTLEKTKK